MAFPVRRARGRWSHGQGDEPGQGLLPHAGATKLDLVQLLPRRRRGHRPRALRAADAAQAPSRTAPRARRSTRSACPRSGPTGSRPRASPSRPAGTPTSSASPRSPRSPGPRTSARIDFHPWPSRRARRRAPGRAADRRRPAARHDVRGREAGRGGRPRGARRARLHRLAEDVGQPRHPRRLPDRAELGASPTCAARALAFAREVERRLPEARDDGVVEGGARRARLHRLQPERARPDDRLGLLGARPSGRDRLGAGDLGRARPTSRPRTSRWRRCRSASRSSATSRPGSTTPSATCACCSSGSSGTRRKGVGEAPYPPHFPKMPGEPKRVQPSRARKREGRQPACVRRRRAGVSNVGSLGLARRAQLSPRCTASGPCRRGSGGSASRGGSGCPAPCRSAPRRRAPAAPPPPRARRCPSGSAPRSAGRARPRAAAATRSAISSCRVARDRGRADVVELAVVAVEAEEQRRDPVRLRLPAQADDDAVGGLVRLHLDDRLARARAGTGWSSRFAITPSRPAASNRSSHSRASSRSRVAGESRKPFARRSSSARRFASGGSCTGSPSQSRTSKATNSAGISRGQLADAALGRVEPHLHRVEVERRRRARSRSRRRARSAAAAARRAAAARGSSAAAAVPLRDQSASSPPTFSSTPRKPSHFGSYCQPSPSGSSWTSSASIGGNGTSSAASATAP